MSILLIIVGFLAVIGGAWLAIGVKKAPAVITGTIAALAGVFLVVLGMSITTVGPSDVGVVTAYGKTEGDIGPGIHVLAPWKNVIIWDKSVQNIGYGRDLNQFKPDHCLQVRIGNQQSVCLALTFQYQVRDPAVDALFVQYRNQGNMNQRLVVTDLDSAIQTQLQTFSPIEAISACQGASTGKACAGTSLVPYAKKVENQMRAEIGGDIKIVKLLLIYPQFDPATQARLNQFQTQVADTLIAKQAIQTAINQKAANEQLAKSVANPNVIAQQCVTNVMIPLVKAGKSPAGVVCPGSGGGGSNTVVIPAGR